MFSVRDHRSRGQQLIAAVFHGRPTMLLLYDRNLRSRIPNKTKKIPPTMDPIPVDPTFVQAILSSQMMQMMGLLLGTLLTGILLTIGISSLFLLSSFKREHGALSRRNRILRVCVIVLLLAVPSFGAGVFVLLNGNVVFFSQPQGALTRFWGKVVASTTMVIILLADGLLVRLL